jgi:ATP-dependent helicase YprA (DUF1998 family)
MQSEPIKYENISVYMLKVTYQESIPVQLAPPTTFWESYTDKNWKSDYAHAFQPGTKIVPKEFQLRATISIISGQDTLIDVGTGYGKTLCMIIPRLLDPSGSISVVISPLKRLQAVQVLEFERYGTRNVAINEDTPNDLELWKV